MLVDVERAKAAGQIEINLHGTALPVAADGVAQDIFELRTVESAFAFVEVPGSSRGRQSGHQSGLGLVPDRILADAFVWPVRELDAYIGEAEILINRED